MEDFVAFRVEVVMTPNKFSGNYSWYIEGDRKSYREWIILTGGVSNTPEDAYKDAVAEFNKVINGEVNYL